MTRGGRSDETPGGDDQRLIDRVLAGDADAEDELLSRYRGLAIGLARGRFAFDPLAANEIWQEVVLKLWADDRKALRSWRGQGRFSTYLTVIVVRLCLRHREARARREAVTEPPEATSNAVDAGPSPERRAVRNERRRLLAAALEQLSPRDRLLLTLRFEDGRTPSEIARLLKLSPGAVRKALHDARKRLRRRLLAASPELFSPAAGNARQPIRSHSPGGGE